MRESQLGKWKRKCWKLELMFLFFLKIHEVEFSNNLNMFQFDFTKFLFWTFDSLFQNKIQVIFEKTLHLINLISYLIILIFFYGQNSKHKSITFFFQSPAFEFILGGFTKTFSQNSEWEILLRIKREAHELSNHIIVSFIFLLTPFVRASHISAPLSSSLAKFPSNFIITEWILKNSFSSWN